VIYFYTRCLMARLALGVLAASAACAEHSTANASLAAGDRAVAPPGLDGGSPAAVGSTPSSAGASGASAPAGGRSDAAASGPTAQPAAAGSGGVAASPSDKDGAAAGADATGVNAQAGADAASAGAAGTANAFPPLTANVTLHVAGDSTAAIFPASDPTQRVGWASVLQQFFGAGVQVDDAAQSGRSSKSFMDEGLWKTLKAKIRAGDYVFIQFAHNDEKMDDPARYTDPATMFRGNLKTYISDTRAAGGFAVLLTPISRRQFSGDKIVATHGAYPAAVIAVGMETGTPVIDMTDKTRVWLESLGPAATVSLFASGDNTHLSAKGAPEVAKLVVQGIKELGLPIAQRLTP
jgi:lysophospholipase L1-like esterase